MARALSGSRFSFVGGLALVIELACSGTPLTTPATADGAAGAAVTPSGAAGAAGVGVSPNGNDPSDCDQLAPPDCAKVSHCQVLRARPVAVEEKCSLPLQDVGCSALGCGGLISWAKDPSGKEWIFPSTCIPAGWTSLSSSFQIGECASCDGLAGADCENKSYCQPLTARPINEQLSCALAPEIYVGCHWTYLGCGGAESQAKDPQGQPWAFPGTCIPAGWTLSNLDGTPDCPSPDGGVASCEALSIAACATTSACHVLMGKEIELDRSCLGPSKPVACTPAGLTCDALITRATGPEGIRWSFASGCVPIGWTDVTGADAYYPDCPVPLDDAGVPVD